MQNYASKLNAQLGTAALSAFNDQPLQTKTSIDILGFQVNTITNYQLVTYPNNPAQQGMIYYQYIDQEQTVTEPSPAPLPIPGGNPGTDTAPSWGGEAPVFE